MKKFLLLSFIAVIAISCGDLKPDISYSKPFPKRKKNLQWKLGEQFSILKYNDTLTYHIKFDNETDINNIINAKTGDTAFSGTISKYRGVYFFDHKINDTAYFISAVDINKSIFHNPNTIKGLGTVYFQKQELINHLKKGKYNKLIKYTNNDSSVIRMLPDKNIMKDAYSNILKDIKPDTLIDIPGETLSAGDNSKTSDKKTSSDMDFEKPDFEENRLIKDLYPNPFQSFFTIKIHDKSSCKYEILNNQGKIIQKGKVNKGIEKINLEESDPGIYYIRVRSGKDFETMKLIKSN